jgi:uncharacterized membrane protein
MWPFKIPKPDLPSSGPLKDALDALVQHCERLYWVGVMQGALMTAVALIVLYLFVHRKKP